MSKSSAHVETSRDRVFLANGLAFEPTVSAWRGTTFQPTCFGRVFSESRRVRRPLCGFETFFCRCENIEKRARPSSPLHIADTSDPLVREGCTPPAQVNVLVCVCVMLTRVPRRVFENISDGAQVVTEEEALAICEAWGDDGGGGGGDADQAQSGRRTSNDDGPRIPVDLFLQLLSPESKEVEK